MCVGCIGVRIVVRTRVRDSCEDWRRTFLYEMLVNVDGYFREMGRRNY